MNHIYRIVWNAALGACVAVAENAKGSGKTGSARSRSVIDATDGVARTGFTLKPACRAALVLFAAAAFLTPKAHAANAADAVVSSGAGSVATSGATTTITQASQRLAIDWSKLSTAAGEALVFNQPNTQAIALNRIIGSNPSEFLGSLTANGQVFILNPNGVLFGAGSQVNVGGLVASTLSMSNADFESGNFKFSGSGAGSVVNQGSLNAAPGGYLALLAPQVRNEGVMTASLGTALLAAGNKVTLNLDNGSLLGYSIDQGAINALAENKQLIKADGGQVLLSAKAMDALTTATVNNTGVIEARTIQNKAGRIMLMGDMEHGTVNVGGTLDASAPNGGNGGFIETSAAHVKVAKGTRVTTQAAAGQTGKWLIDPNDFTIAATGGDMDAATVVSNLATTNFEIQTATMGTAGNGDIHVNEALTWTTVQTLTLTAERNINVNQAITATNGGLTLNAVNQISAPAAVNVGTFTLTNGVWSQIGTLPSFSATDFRINGGTFIRALGGDGLSAGTAYQLTDIYGLQGAGSVNMLNKHYKLANDIDASGTAAWNAGLGFKSIGDDYNLRNFTGSMNGQNHVISNLTINRPTTDYVGLFGMAVGGSSVSNLGLVGGSITGRSSVGALMGRNYLSSITNSYSEASVIGLLGGVGGLVGYNTSTITNSYASGTVNGPNAIGGLVGVNYGDISSSYASGATTGTSNTGALVGNAQGGNITASFWRGSATPGFGYNGATVDGFTRGLTNAEFNSAATYSAAGWNASNVGGDGKTWRIYEGQTGPLLRSFLTGYNLTPTFDGSASSPANIGAYGEAGADPTKLLGTAAATDKLTLSNAGTADGYTASTSATGRYSYQQGYDLTATRAITTAGSAAGDVRLDNNISFTNGTLTIAATGNIDLNGKAITASSGRLQIDSGTAINAGIINVDVFNMAGGTWNQVGSTPAAFAARDFGVSGGTFIRALAGDGTFGNAYQITDAYGLQSAGSAGMLNKNFKLANNIDASGTDQWNSFAGFKPIGDAATNYTGTFDGNNKTISNLDINRAAQNDVGLFGQLGAGGMVANVGLTNVRVLGKDSVGGLVGNNNGGQISNSYVTGNVAGRDYVGGLAGLNSGGGNISNSYATSSATGRAAVGGLAGFNDDMISNSYSAGSVTGSSLVGGLVGHVSGGTISDSFWNTDTSGQATSAGGTGKTTAQMKQASTFSSWSIATTGGSNNIWRIYEGNTGPLLRSFLTGLTLADTTVTYNGATQLGVTTADSRVQGSNASARNAGSYTTGYYSNQQGVDISGGALTIGKANLVLATSDVIKTYDGGLSALGTAVVAGGTVLQTGDTMSGGSFAFTNKNAGTGNKTVTTSGVTVSDGNSGNNYNVSYVDNTLSTITPKALTVSGVTADSKVYDQTNSATVNTTSAVLGGLIAGDVLAINATGTFTDKNAATGKTVNLTSSYTGADVGNYAITSQATTTADITPKALTVSGVTADNKVYDQTTAATVSTTGAVLGGLIAGDALAISTTGTFIDKNAATGKTVNLTSNYTGADVGNYTITDQTTTTANIGKLAIVGTINGQDKVYDGNTTATIGFRNLTGVISGDDVTYTGGIASFGDKNAGIAKTLTATGLSLTGADAGNYTVNSAATSTGDIDRATLTVTAAAQNKVYDATTVATLSYTDNRIAGDALLFSTNASFADKNVGTAKTVTYSGLAQTGADAGNYTLISATSGTSNADITPASLSVVANNDTRIAGTAYSGGNGVVYAGLVAGETAAVLGGVLTYGGSSQGANAAGSYAITPGGYSSSNYAISYLNGVLSLTSGGSAEAALGGTALVTAYGGALQAIGGLGASLGGGGASDAAGGDAGALAAAAATAGDTGEDE